MVLDQLQITLLEEGRDVKFRNLWSDHVWKNTAVVREDSWIAREGFVGFSVTAGDWRTRPGV